MRLGPIRPLFKSLHGIVRSTSKDLGKIVQFDVRGEDTLIDRAILDVVGDPIIHMIRNSIDHGLETADEREKIGVGISRHALSRDVGRGLQTALDGNRHRQGAPFEKAIWGDSGQER